MTVVYSGVKNAKSPADITPQGAALFKTAMLIVPLILIVAGFLVYAWKYRIDEETFKMMVDEIEKRENERIG